MQQLSTALSRVATARPAPPAPAPAPASLSVPADAGTLRDALALIAQKPSPAVASALSDLTGMEARHETDAEARSRLGRAETVEERTIRREEAFTMRRPLMVAPGVLPEVEKRIAALRAALRPAAAETAEEWLLSLAAISERAPEGEKLDDTVAALVGALDLPACCYTAESLRAASDATLPYGFMPGFAKINRALRPFAVAAENELRRLEQIAGAARRAALPPPERPVVPGRTEAEVEAVTEAAERFRQEVAARGGDEPLFPRGAGRGPRVPPLGQRLADLEVRMEKARVDAMLPGAPGKAAGERLRNMEVTARRWRMQLDQAGGNG